VEQKDCINTRGGELLGCGRKKKWSRSRLNTIIQTPAAKDPPKSDDEIEHHPVEELAEENRQATWWEREKQTRSEKRLGEGRGRGIMEGLLRLVLLDAA